MKRTLTAAALAAILAIASSSAVLAEETSHRYRVVSERSQSTEVRVTTSGSTWFTGTDARGDRVMVVFLPRFNTVLRDGVRIPVSYLRPGDRVDVAGQARKHRLYASSAQVVTPRTTATAR
jgi:hypothetical protein